MERNFTNENFEGFLRQNAEGLRMRPNERVWKGISKHLNRRRRRIGFILSVSLLTISSLGYYLMDNTARQTSRSELAPTINQPLTSGNTSGLSDQQIAGKTLASSITQPSIRNQASNTTVRNLDILTSGLSEMMHPLYSGSHSLMARNDFKPLAIDSYNITDVETPLASLEDNIVEETDPLMIEAGVSAFQPKTKKNKLDWQIYFTPTVSYRKLNENKTYLLSVPLAGGPLPNLDNINSAVTHKPDFGFEVGFGAKYPVSQKAKIRAGLQFNVNRYDIKAFSSPTQTATIRLNDNNTSVSTSSNYNNFTGYKTNWLENFYFQVSAPVGIELKVRGDDKMQFGIASTIQPTYVLGERAYLISSDYKNYAEVPWLTRRWNVNTNFETFVAYSTGKLKWQVGPQVRYQLLSSFVKEYPVKENLFDFGLKVGVSLNNQQ